MCESVCVRVCLQALSPIDTPTDFSGYKTSLCTEEFQTGGMIHLGELLKALIHKERVRIHKGPRLPAGVPSGECIAFRFH